LTTDTIPIELENGDKIYLKSFHSNNVKEFIQFIKDYDLLDFGDSGPEGTAILHATGGGAYKYQDLFE